MDGNTQWFCKLPNSLDFINVSKIVRIITTTNPEISIIMTTTGEPVKAMLSPARLIEHIKQNKFNV